MAQRKRTNKAARKGSKKPAARGAKWRGKKEHGDSAGTTTPGATVVKPDPAVQKAIKQVQKQIDAANAAIRKASNALAGLTGGGECGTTDGPKTEVWVQINDSRIGADGWMQLELREGQKLRVVQPAVRGTRGVRTGKDDQGGVVLEGFDYEDEDIEKQVKKATNPEDFVKASDPPNKDRYVIATRVVRASNKTEVIATGFPTPPTGMFVKRAFSTGVDLMNEFHPE